VRVFRRAQAVREVVKGQRLQNVSDALQLPILAWRTWVHRFANQGVQGLGDRPRPGRPAQSRAHSKSISTASSIKTPWSTAPSLPKELP